MTDSESPATTEVVEPGVAERLHALMATTTVVPDAPLPRDLATGIDRELRALIRRATDQLCANGTDPQQRLLHGLAAATTVLRLAAELERGLMRQALDAGVSESRVATACGVSQQAINRRVQRGL